MTSALWVFFRNDDTWWRVGGEEGVKNCQNGGDVICGCPLSIVFLNILKVDICGNKMGNSLMFYITILCCFLVTKLNFFHNEFCFVAWKSHPSLDKVNSTQHSNNRLRSHDFFVVSSHQIQNEEIYSNNMEKMSKCLKLHVQL